MKGRDFTERCIRFIDKDLEREVAKDYVKKIYKNPELAAENKNAKKAEQKRESKKNIKP